ncbi:MAG: circularly permuted type 2 ATP-grasp protein, partial [Rhodobiaceae bacterium]|nr:circularly permuted type 2 ATP-grasp protein [Rhodobiaceae bacterium]
MTEHTTFDEMHHPDGAVRDAYVALDKWLQETEPSSLARRQHEAEILFRRIGITFAVYGEETDQERIIPFDVIPRILTRSEWERLETGLVQRVNALNMFLKDVYTKQDILKAGIIPDALVFQNPAFRPEMKDVVVAGDVYTHIAGIDIVRVDEEDFYVLEDNARTPSGVSY